MALGENPEPPPPACRVSVMDLRVLRAAAARPCRAGVPNAEPGGGRASGAAQRRRLDLIRLNSAAQTLVLVLARGAYVLRRLAW
jgi:hypothetical protein